MLFIQKKKRQAAFLIIILIMLALYKFPNWNWWPLIVLLQTFTIFWLIDRADYNESKRNKERDVKSKKSV